MNSKITQLDPAECRPHPLLARMAMETEVIAYLRTAEGNTEDLERHESARAALIESVRTLGILKPVWYTRDAEGNVLIADGRHRREAAELAGVKLPGIEISEDQARNIIFASVAHHRHLTKGAVAWLAVIMHPEIADTKRGRPANSENFGVSRAELAAQAGVSVDLIDQACAIFNLTRKSSKQRDRIDAAIAAGKALWALKAGLEGDGSLPTDADGKKRRPEPGFKGYLRTLGTFKTQLKSAAKWSDENRDAVITATADFLRENGAAAALFRDALERAAEGAPVEGSAAAPSPEPAPEE